MFAFSTRGWESRKLGAEISFTISYTLFCMVFRVIIYCWYYHYLNQTLFVIVLNSFITNLLPYQCILLNSLALLILLYDIIVVLSKFTYNSTFNNLKFIPNTYILLLNFVGQAIIIKLLINNLNDESKNLKVLHFWIKIPN